MYQNVLNRYRREKSGYDGERSLNYYFNFLPQNAVFLHGLRIEEMQYTFQIDHLILFPNFFLIIEVKNKAGLINYNSETGVLKCFNNDGTYKRYDDPFIQARIQRFKLKKLLQQSSFTVPPIHTLVVFSHQDAVLEIEGHQPDLIISQRLPWRVSELEQKYSTTYFEKDELIKVGKMLKNRHKPKEENIVEECHIKREHIRNGVWCTNCKKFIMKRYKRNWHCPSCKHKDDYAHLKALEEYRLMFGETIKNSEAREFLQVSKDVARRLLKTTCSTYVGDRKSRVYRLSQT
ncbi:nuclease-related domain-containing protein [Alkalibacillus haloalkaliphilus]|uniref:nuclease-related domain-containing protein n=1 Tax=Alkalibacillus haloalkaliphilus TaxID=94136 RepID=UPI00293664F1|nr:nuclease-related domain-containing protein [Alkalibacillus haloalkaliphilus]MDV2582838.1 nuclease-related domain-containing protein [Alkalibacillus haloalkaliphilus]